MDFLHCSAENVPCSCARETQTRRGSATFSPNSRYVLVATLDGTIRLWNHSTQECVREYRGHVNGNYASAIKFYTPGRQYVIAASEDAQASPRALSSDFCVPTTPHKSVYRSVSTLDVRRYLFTAAFAFARSAQVHVWDTNSAKRVHTFRSHTAPLLALDVHPLNNIVATGALEQDPVIRLWTDTAHPSA